MSDKFSFRGGDPEGVPDGDYVLTVAGGHVTGLTPAPIGGGGTGIVESIVAGANVTVDSTDPANPVVSATTGGGGGGAATQQYVGKDAIGATWEGMTWRRVYLKKITLTQAGLLTDVEAYIRQGGGSVGNLSMVLHADAAGSVGQILSVVGSNVADALAMSATTPDRWFSMAMGRWLAAGSYWIGVTGLDNSMTFQIPYDTGTDVYYNSGGNWVADGGQYASVASGRDYSIRANLLTF